MTPDEHDALLVECQTTVAEILTRTTGCDAEALLPTLFAAYQHLLGDEADARAAEDGLRLKLGLVAGQRDEARERAEKAEAELALVYKRIQAAWESSVAVCAAVDRKGDGR